MRSWSEHLSDLSSVLDRQLFFVDGQPRSGTTWLQQLLDAHPDISCQGEAQFRDHLAVPLDTAMRTRFQALHERNTSIFGHTGGYPLPVADDTQYLLGTAMLQAFSRQALSGQAGDRPVRAIGEKTPGNLFFFPQLRSLFPDSRLVCIARDPRDVITSAWHRFQRRPDSSPADLSNFVSRVLPMAERWMDAMDQAPALYPGQVRVLTFESLLSDGPAVLAGVYRFLGVSDDQVLVAQSFDRTDFAVQTGGRAAGTVRDGAFHRSGVAGAWRSTLSEAMSAQIVERLGRWFPRFGWRA